MINNNVIDNILSRKSIRKYTDKIIPQSKIKIILDAAMAAPTANNRRPYHFIVVSDPIIKHELTKINPYSKMIEESSHTIVVCGDIVTEPTMDFIHHDCAAATQNILLAAHSLGLGAVWVGVRQEDVKGWGVHVSEVLKLPSNIKPIALIPIGYPDQKREAKARYEEEKVHYNNW